MPPPETASSIRGHLRRLAQSQHEHAGGAPRWVTAGLPVAAILITLASVYWNMTLRDQLIWQESSIRALMQQNDRLTEDLRATSVELKATGELLGARVGVAPGDLDQKANDLAERQQAADAAEATQKNGGHSPQPAAPAAGAQHSYLHFFAPAPAPAGQHKYLHFFSPGSTAGSSATPAGQPGSQPGNTVPTLPRTIDGTHPAEPDLTAPRLGTVHAPPRTDGTPEPAPVPASRGAGPLPVFAPRAGFRDPVQENAAEVAALSKSSGRRLEEFHVHEGKETTPLPNLGLEVRKPDEKHGTYTLVVVEGKSHVEKRGRVNEPLLVAEWPTGQQCQLVVLNIQKGQIFGYLAGLR